VSQGDAPTSNAELVCLGWTRRFTAIGGRLDEAVALYRGLGFEVRLEAAERGTDEVPATSGCAQCFVMSLARTIYTRPSGGSTDEIAAER
jgi:hypothetical protein